MIIEIPDLKLRSPYLSLGIEETLAEYYSKNYQFDGLLRLWINPPTVVLGRTCKLLENVNSEVLSKIIGENKIQNKNKIHLVRRLSGGGTVYHSNGSLNYTIILPISKYPEFRSISNSYEIILNFVILALEKQGIKSTIMGLSDLAMWTKHGFKKFSGNSQFRKFNMLVHHGTIILNEHVIKEINSILKHPPKEPEYRNKRDHKDFLIPLPSHFDISLFYNCLLNELKSYLNITESRFIYRNEFNDMKNLLIKKIKYVYKNPLWIYEGKYVYKEIITE